MCGRAWGSTNVHGFARAVGAALQPGGVDGAQHARDAEAVVAVHVRDEQPADTCRSRSVYRTPLTCSSARLAISSLPAADCNQG